MDAIVANQGSTQDSNKCNYLVVSTHFKSTSQIGSFPQVGMKIKIFETTT